MASETFDAVLAEMLGESTLFLHEITDYHTRLAAAHAAEVEALKESLDGKRHEANAAWAAAEAAERDARELREAVQRAESLLSKFIATTEQADEG